MRCPECKGEGWITYLGGCWQQCPTCKGRRELETSVEKVEVLKEDEIVVADTSGPVTIHHPGQMPYEARAISREAPVNATHRGTQELMQLLLDKVDKLETEIDTFRRSDKIAGPVGRDDEQVMSESTVVVPGAKSSMIVSPTLLLRNGNERFRLSRILVTATSDIDGADMARQGLVENITVGPYPVISSKIPCEAFEGPLRMQRCDDILVDLYSTLALIVVNRDKLRPIRFDAMAWVYTLSHAEQCRRDQHLREHFTKGHPHGR